MPAGPFSRAPEGIQTNVRAGIAIFSLIKLRPQERATSLTGKNPGRAYNSENRYASSAMPSNTTDRFIAIPDQVQ